jgi:hypothetical protein
LIPKGRRFFQVTSATTGWRRALSFVRSPAGQPGRPPARPRLLGEVGVVVFLLVVYDRVADLARVRVTAAENHASGLLGLERLLRLAVEQPLDLAVAPHRHLGQALSLYYDFAHGLVTLAVLGGLYLARPGLYRRARRALVLANVAALAVFVALPVAPPRLLPGGGYPDVVALSGTPGAWDATNGVSKHADQYGSFPSLHAAWALWVLVAVWGATRRPSVRALAVAHLGLTTLVVLATGNHYVLDVVGGVFLVALAWTAADLRLPAPRPGALRSAVPRSRPRAATAAASFPPPRVPTGSAPQASEPT